MVVSVARSMWALAGSRRSAPHPTLYIVEPLLEKVLERVRTYMKPGLLP